MTALSALFGALAALLFVVLVWALVVRVTVRWVVADLRRLGVLATPTGTEERSS
jgi:hypothetical protein